MKIFGSNAGKVIAMDARDGLPAVIRLTGLSSSEVVLIMSVGVDQRANVQFMPSLKDSIYVYAFGEHMGAIKVAGTAFWQSCSGQKDGLLDVLKYYETNTVSRTQKRVKISFGLSSKVVRGFLTAVNITAMNPETGASSFQMVLSTLPFAK